MTARSEATSGSAHSDVGTTANVYAHWTQAMDQSTADRAQSFLADLGQPHAAGITRGADRGLINPPAMKEKPPQWSADRGVSPGWTGADPRMRIRR